MSNFFIGYKIGNIFSVQRYLQEKVFELLESQEHSLRMNCIHYSHQLLFIISFIKGLYFTIKQKPCRPCVLVYISEDTLGISLKKQLL